MLEFEEDGARGGKAQEEEEMAICMEREGRTIGMGWECRGESGE